jgi:hypothetical protein
MAEELFTFDTSRLSANIKKLLAESAAKKKTALWLVSVYLEGQARDAAPVDEGHLTSDIRGNVQEADGVMAAVISVPANAPSAEYAVAMHENIYKLGKESLARQAKYGKPVGRKYITNPIMRAGDKIMKIITQALKL